MNGPRARERLVGAASRAASERRGNAARPTGASEAKTIARVGDFRRIEAGSRRSDLVGTPRPEAPVGPAGIIGEEKLPSTHVVLITEDVHVDEEIGADEPARRIFKGVDGRLGELHRGAVGGQSIALNRPDFCKRWTEEPSARRRTTKAFTETPQIDPRYPLFPFLNLAEAFRRSPGARATAGSENLHGSGGRTIEREENCRSRAEPAHLHGL